MAADRVILVECDLVSPAGAAITLRFSDRAIRPMSPTDADRPNAVWEDRIAEAPAIRRALVEDLAGLTPGWGVAQLQLFNGDGALTPYAGHAWKAVRVYRWTEGAAFSTALRLFSGQAAVPSFSRSARSSMRVSVGLYDPMVELDQPLQAHLYAGSGGLEGPAELRDQVKPLAFGDLSAAHVPGRRVDAASNLYQLHDGAIGAAVQIFDRGDSAGLISDGDKSGATFDAYAPAAAHYVTDKGRGLVKFNSNPVGTVAFGLTGDATGGSVTTAGPILARLLQRLGVSAGRIGASVAALADAGVIGLYDQSGGDGRSLIAWVARSALAAVLPDRQGVWGASALAPPKAVADFSLGYMDVLDIADDGSAPLPVGSVRVAWGRVWSTYSADSLAPALRGTASADRLGAEYRYVQVDNATAKGRGVGAWRVLEIDSALRTEADALALANRAMALFGPRADGTAPTLRTIQIEATDAALAVPLGATIALTYPPRGIAGRFILVAEEPLKPRRDLLTWSLWG